MPNHIHLLVSVAEGWTLEKLLHSWRSFSAKGINKHLKQSGPVWQRDYYDRIIRDENHFARCVRYIRNNPRKAKLTKNQFTLYETALAKSYT